VNKGRASRKLCKFYILIESRAPVSSLEGDTEEEDIALPLNEEQDKQLALVRLRE